MLCWEVLTFNFNIMTSNCTCFHYTYFNNIFSLYQFLTTQLCILLLNWESWEWEKSIWWNIYLSVCLKQAPFWPLPDLVSLRANGKREKSKSWTQRGSGEKGTIPIYFCTLLLQLTQNPLQFTSRNLCFFLYSYHPKDKEGGRKNSFLEELRFLAELELLVSLWESHQLEPE